MTRSLLVLGSVLTLVASAFAGGPLLVGGPNFGIDGAPFTWANGVVNYRVDGGPFASGMVAVDNATGIARVQSMFATWSSVTTASITPTKVGAIQATGVFTDGDVSTVAEFDAVSASCDVGTQSPIIFDATGNIFQTLVGDPSVIGFAGPCDLDSNGHILSGFAMMNGSFQDGVDNSTNFEITAAQFDQALTHEIGHFLGLDHAQVNVEMLDVNTCGNDHDFAGLPVMFPFLICAARPEGHAPKLAPDDMAWISRLYPSGSFASVYGVIQGRIYFSDGITGAQGVNVLARDVSDPRAKATNVVSGFLFTNDPGQSVTGTDTGGSSFGSRDPQKEGFYELVVPASSYTVEVESIYPDFSEGSSVGPLVRPTPNPGANEFWNDTESAPDDPTAKTTIVVTPGAVITGKDIVLNGTLNRFDRDEDEN